MGEIRKSKGQRNEFRSSITHKSTTLSIVKLVMFWITFRSQVHILSRFFLSSSLSLPFFIPLSPVSPLPFYSLPLSVSFSLFVSIPIDQNLVLKCHKPNAWTSWSLAFTSNAEHVEMDVILYNQVIIGLVVAVMYGYEHLGSGEELQIY